MVNTPIVYQIARRCNCATFVQADSRSQASTDLYFVIWPADEIGPSSSQIPYHIDSGESFTQTLTSAGTYSVFVYDSGTNSNKDAVISSFPLRCQ